MLQVMLLVVYLAASPPGPHVVVRDSEGRCNRRKAPRVRRGGVAAINGNYKYIHRVIPNPHSPKTLINSTKTCPEKITKPSSLETGSSRVEKRSRMLTSHTKPLVIPNLQQSSIPAGSLAVRLIQSWILIGWFKLIILNFSDLR